MCSLTPFPITNWPLLNHNIGYGQKYINYEGNESIDSIFLRFPPQDEEVLLDHRSPSFTAQTSSCVDPGVVKKLNHNASERDRRKKVNHLYSSLRSLLPASAQMKKLSFPATVSHALKYIPELQQQVEGLVQKKEKLLLRISQQRKSTITRRRGPTPSTDSSAAAAAVSINRSSERDVSIQISMHKTQNNLLSEILQFFEQDGSLQLLNANCFEPSGGMLFYDIHLQMENTYKLESEALSDKLLSLFDNREDLLINY